MAASSKTPSPVRRRIILIEKRIADDEFMAAAIGDVEWLRQSLRGTTTISFDKNGLAPIHLAAIHGRYECIKLLVQKFKVDANLPSTSGWRPVHLCISNQTGKRALQSLKYLLSKGADPSIPNDDGITPMHQAASEGHVECLKALIAAGGNINDVDARGHKPIDLAKLWGHRQCARILAAEIWHQNKEHVFNQMKELKKLQMKRVMEEIDAEMEHQVQLDYTSSQAYKQWLDTHDFSPKASLQATASRVKQRKNWEQRMQREKQLKDERATEQLAKTNSKKRARQRPPSTIPEEDTVPKVDVEEMSNDLPSHLTPSHPSPAKDVVRPPPVVIEIPTNSSGKPFRNAMKLPPPPYLARLPDHFPRDEYTKLPWHPPHRSRKSSPLKIGKLPDLDLPPDVIIEALIPQKFEKANVYKAKAIELVQKRKHFELDEIRRPECGVHLTNDINSALFQVALLKKFHESVSASSQSSHASFSDLTVQSSTALADFMKHHSRPLEFPNVGQPT